MSTYRVRGWNDNFEGAKSRTYNNKTTCQMPSKHGLGYRRLVRRKNGPALFGAWCALIQILSRHNKERDGYCTDTGRQDGKPYTASDLELLTDIPEKVFEELLQVASSQDVDWLDVITTTDTTRIPDGDHKGTMVPLHSNLDLDSDSDSDLDSSEPQAASDPPPPHFILIPIVGNDEGFPIPEAAISEFESLYPAVDVRQTLREIRGWNLANRARRKTANGVMRHINAWMSKEQNKGVDGGGYSRRGGYEPRSLVNLGTGGL